MEVSGVVSFRYFLYCPCDASDLRNGFARENPIGVITGCQTGINIRTRDDGGISDGGDEGDNGE
jgi:hypothetical protein